KHYLAFGINGAEYFRISPNGRALFGTTSDNGTGIIQAAGRVRAIGFSSTVDSSRIAYSSLLSNDEIGFYANGTVTGKAYHTYSNISASNHVFLSSANNHSTGAICLSLAAINGN